MSSDEDFEETAGNFLRKSVLNFPMGAKSF